MPALSTIYADFNNADPNGRLRLSCSGTVSDLTRLGIVFKSGDRFIFSDGELSVEGIVEYSDSEARWVAVIDWDKVRTIDEQGESKQGDV